MPSPGQTLSGPASSILGELFVARDDAPAAARALPPEKLAQWYASTLDARTFLPAYLAYEKAIARERSTQDAMLFTWPTNSTNAEHGQYPDRTEDLVGPYLKTMPPSYQEQK